MADIGMVTASILFFLGFIMSIVMKCKQFSENGYKIVTGILAGLVILGGMIFFGRITL